MTAMTTRTRLHDCPSCRCELPTPKPVERCPVTFDGYRCVDAALPLHHYHRPSLFTEDQERGFPWSPDPTSSEQK